MYFALIIVSSVDKEFPRLCLQRHSLNTNVYGDVYLLNMLHSLITRSEIMFLDGQEVLLL